MKSKPVLGWDSCIFVAWLKGETCWPADATAAVAAIVQKVDAGEILLVLPSILLSELLDSFRQPDLDVRFKNFLARRDRDGHHATARASGGRNPLPR